MNQNLNYSGKYSKVFSEKVKSKAPYQMNQDMLYIRGNRPKEVIIPRDTKEELPPQDIAPEIFDTFEVSKDTERQSQEGVTEVANVIPENYQYEIVMPEPTDMELVEEKEDVTLETTYTLRENNITMVMSSKEIQQVMECVSYFENKLQTPEIEKQLGQIINDTYMLIEKMKRLDEGDKEEVL